MENLRPIQRIAVIAICLAMTAVLALLLIPWVSEQLESRLEDRSGSPEPATESTPTPTPVSWGREQAPPQSKVPSSTL
jgi:hypothetical protein